MKAIKRTVAGLLATLMLATSFSFTSFTADNYTDEEAIAVSKVNAASIMTGTENGFEPSKTLTRAEAAAIVVRMKGVPETQVNGAKGNTLFTDVPASNWAAGYINAASSMGIISGVGNGLFLPEREVTIVEFAAMAIRALGAGKLVDSIGTWPTNYVNFATEEKLFEGVLKAYTAPATRMDVAFMVVNTIEANMWEKTEVTNTSEVTYKKQDDKTILGTVLKISVSENEVVDSLDTKERTVDFKSNNFANYDVVEGVEIATLKSGMEVDVWAKVEDKEIIRIAPAEHTKQAKVAFNGIKKIDLEKNRITLLVDGKEKKYTLERDDQDALTLELSFNTQDAPVVVTEDDGDDEDEAADNFIAELDPEGDIDFKDMFGTAMLEGNKVTTLYVEAFTAKGVVKEIKNDMIYFSSDVKETKNTQTLELDDEDIEYVVTKNGKEIDVTDIEEGDAVYYYTDGDDRYVMVVNNTVVEGKAKKVASDEYVKVDGKEYELSPSVAEVDVTAGDEVKLYLNGRDEIVMYQVLDGAADSTVAIVKAIWEKDGDRKGSDSIVMMNLVALDGTEVGAKEVNLTASAKKLMDITDPEDPTLAFQTDSKADADKLKTALLYDITDDADTDDVDEEDGDTRADIVGRLVRYSISDGKYVIKEFDNDGMVVTAYDKTKMVALAGTEDYNEKSNSLDSYYLDENTEIFVVKELDDEEDAKYEVKLEKVKFADLGSTDNLEGYVYNVHKNTNIIDALVVTSTVKRSTDKNYAVVLKVTEVTNDDDDKYNVELLLLVKGEKEARTVLAKDVELDPGDIIEAFISDDNKLEEKSDVTATEVEANVYVFNEKTVSILNKVGNANEVPAIAENCIFFAENEEGKLVVGSKTGPDGIKAIAGTVKTYTADEKYAVKAYKVVNEETTKPEIIAMQYTIVK